MKKYIMYYMNYERPVIRFIADSHESLRAKIKNHYRIRKGLAPKDEPLTMSKYLKGSMVGLLTISDSIEAEEFFLLNEENT